MPIPDFATITHSKLGRDDDKGTMDRPTASSPPPKLSRRPCDRPDVGGDVRSILEAIAPTPSLKLGPMADGVQRTCTRKSPFR